MNNMDNELNAKKEGCFFVPTNHEEDVSRITYGHIESGEQFNAHVGPRGLFTQRPMPHSTPGILLLSRSTSLLLRLRHAVEALGLPIENIDPRRFANWARALPQLLVIDASLNEELMEHGGHVWPAGRTLYIESGMDDLDSVPPGALKLPYNFSSVDARSVVRSILEASDLTASDAAADPLLITKSPQMRTVLADLTAYAPTGRSVLIQGDTGVGKELMARRIHALDPAAASGPFIPVNCGAIPEGLFESLFFGHVKGAFTGALHAHKGYMQQANGGTLFLDEVADLPRLQQVKLLRALETGEVTPVGSERPVQVRFRVIAASNRRIRTLIDTGEFRPDLFYRLAVIELRVPNLDTRGAEDKIALFSAFLRQAGASEAPEWLLAIVARTPFPGNVRQLRNLAERVAVITRQRGAWDRTQIERAIDMVCGGSPQAAPRRAKSESEERMAILRALRDHGWRRQETAQALGMSRTSLWQKIHKFSIEDGEQTEPAS